MKSVKIGSVGLGRLGYEHAKNLATLLPGCTLHAVCDVDEARLQSVAEELDIPRTYTDFADMCADPELDAVAIVSPSFLHVEQIRIAMEHGKHVFCEKPLGIDVAQCKEAEKVVEAHPELVFQLGFMRRFDPSYAEAKRRVDAGEIGKVVLVRSYTQDPRSTIESTLKFAPHSGGQFLDMCVHDLDLVRWFTGSNIKNVWGLGGVFEFDLYRELNDADNAAAMVQCENGARQEYYPDFMSRWHTAFLAEMRAFTDHIRNGTRPADMTVYDGTAVSEAAYRCKESFETGKMLPIR